MAAGVRTPAITVSTHLHVACGLVLELPHALAREAGRLAQVGARRPPLAPVVQVVKLPPEVVHLRMSEHSMMSPAL